MGLPDRNQLENQQLWEPFREWLWKVYDYINGVGDIPAVIAAVAGYAGSAASDAASAGSSATDAEHYRDQALAAAAANGPFRVYLSYAAALADIAAVPANGFVEIEADETRPETPRVRYQKVSGAYVFVLDLDRYQTQLLTLPQQYKVAEFLDRVKTQPCRIITQGTSIAIGDQSAVQSVPEMVANVYGRNLSVIQNMGIWGGTYGTTDGHKKQIYGGSHFVRLVLASGQNDIVFSPVNVDKIVVVYGKEAGGGACDVWIDGVYDSTINCNGAQAYNQEKVITFPSRGIHQLTLKANTGKAYLERVEWLLDDPGVYIENGTIGGFGMRHSITLSPDPVGNEPGIPIVGLNGVDAIYNRQGVTKPALCIVQQQTNDGALGITDFTTAIRRAVATTKASSVPVVLCTEMIASAYLNADGTIRPNSTGGIRETIAEIVSHGKEKHVALLDWSKMSDHSNFAAYDAKYFPTIDKTHPTEQGYIPLVNAMAALFNVPHPGQRYKYNVVSENVEAKQTVPSVQSVADPYNYKLSRPGIVKAKPQDVFHDQTLTVVGEASTLVNKRCDLMQARDVPNLVIKSYLADIAASSTEDQYGKYKRLGVNEVYGVFAPFAAGDVDQIYTVVLQLKPVPPSPGGQLRFYNGVNNKYARVYVGDELLTDTGMLAVGNFVPQLSRSKPTFLSFQLRLNATDTVGSSLTMVGSGLDIYGIWVTEGKQAVITPRLADTYRGIGLPVFMTGDYGPADVTIGQTYQELINGTTIEKVALNGYCFKPLSGTYHRVYELRNKGAIRFGRLPVLGPGSLAAYNGKVGGELLATSTGLGAGAALGAVGIFGSGFPNGKRFTAAWRSQQGANAVKIAFYNGASNTWTGLQPDGSWATGPIGGQPILYSSVLGISGVVNAVSFDAPDASFNTGLGADPLFYIGFVSGSGQYGPGTVCEGSSAIVGAP